MTTPYPGASEVGWLADLKQMAEQVGALVFGEAIRWEVEVVGRTGLQRPDVVIRRERDGSILASGEAKRPDTPAGVHPLVASEVRNAREKAARLGSPVFFTTNFFEAAVFDGNTSRSVSDLDRLQGGLISIVPETLAAAPNWWVSSTAADRNVQVLLGLRHLLERIRAAQGGGLGRDINEVALFVFSRVTDRLVQPLYEALLHERGLGHLDPAINNHALRVHLVIQHDEQLRFLAAQGVAEVLTGILFYRNIADHFSLGPLLGGTVPRTSAVLLTRLIRSLSQAMVASDDYETILRLSPIARFVLTKGGEPTLAHWKDLIAFVDQLDFTTVTSDVIGSIFERLISPERRHAMGQHYTNSRLARSMSRWSLRDSADVIADISCGAGTFLVELHRLMADFGRSHQQILAQLLGNDMDPFAVHLASINLVTRDIYRGANYPAVRLGDAFDIEPGVPVIDVQPTNGARVLVGWPMEGLNALIGNPPYAEKPDDLERLKRRLTQIGYPYPTGMQGGNLAAWFFVLAAALINHCGVIAFVMPTGVLQNSNLEVWRSWLRRHFDVTIWHCEDDVWFSDARVATCVILATSRSKSEQFGRLFFVNVKERVEGGLFSIDGIPSPVANAKIRDISHIDANADILVEGACPDLLQKFSTSNHVDLIKGCQWLKVFSGNKLGHAFFQLRDLAPTKNTIVRRVSGFKMEFDLTRTHLRPLLSSPKDERTGEFRKSEYWVLSAPEKLPSSGQLRNYIEAAKKLGVHRAPSVAQRGANWWNVDWRESQIAVQIHPGFLHQVWWSPEPFVAKNNFHVFAFSDGVSQSDRELVAAGLASGWGALAALYVSSEVGCEGVRWLSTGQLGEWPILVPSSVSKADRDEVISAFRLFRQLEAREIQSMEPTSVAAWLSLTKAVAQAAGMSSPQHAAEDCLALARETCERRTRRETIALAGRIRKAGSTGRSLAKHITERLLTMPLAASILADLTGGDRQLRLRSSAQLAQTAFNFEAEDTTVLGEAALTDVLGPGFECAPVSRPEEPEYLADAATALINEILLFVVGAAPYEGGAALHTYQETAAEVRRITVQWLRQEVEKRLS